jgi:virginiamycin B lyase
VAVTDDGLVWYTGQFSAEMGLLDPSTGEIERIPLGAGSSPHGVVVGPDGAAWITDMGLNAIVRVDGDTFEVATYPLPQADAAPHTGVFAPDGIFWFTASAGYYGRLDPATETIELFPAPQGSGPYGITATPEGDIYFANLNKSYIAHVHPETGEATLLQPPTPGQGARRVWSDSQGRIWVSEWNAGQMALYDPSDGSWREWRLPGDAPMAYAVYVDEDDIVWLSDFGGDSLWSFDPATEQFTQYPLPTAQGRVRQILGIEGEVWGAESAVDKLLVVRTGG